MCKGVTVAWRWRDDPWLAEALGLPARELLLPGDEPDADGLLPPLVLRSLDEGFVYIKIPVGHVRTLAALVAAGFRLVDTAITLERYDKTLLAMGAMGAVRENDAALRLATPEDRDAVAEQARHAYHLTRFHQDPLIPRATADDIQARWAAHYFVGGRGDFMLVSHAGQRLAGFLLALTPDPGTLVVDLIAVAPEWQGQGRGAALMAAAQRHSHAHVMRTGTQLANTASLAFYQRLGFVVCHAAHTLHRHPHSSQKYLDP